MVLRTWSRNNNLLTFICDHVVEGLGEALGIEVIIEHFKFNEITGAGTGTNPNEHLGVYDMELTLVSYTGA